MATLKLEVGDMSHVAYEGWWEQVAYGRQSME